MLFSSFFLGDNSFHSRMPLRFDNFEACVCERVSLTHRDTDTEAGREREGREGKVLFFSCEIFLLFFKNGNSLMKCSLLQFKILPLGFSLLKISSVFFFPYSSYESFLCFPERMPISLMKYFICSDAWVSLIKSLMVLFSCTSMCSFVFRNFFLMFFFSY